MAGDWTATRTTRGAEQAGDFTGDTPAETTRKAFESKGFTLEKSGVMSSYNRLLAGGLVLVVTNGALEAPQSLGGEGITATVQTVDGQILADMDCASAREYLDNYISEEG